jgi:hypothetical protein
LLVVAGVGIWLSGVGSAAGEGNALLSIEPASQNIGVNAEQFALDVKVSNVENLGAFDITVTFNKDVLEYVGIAKGPFLTSSGRTAQCIAPQPVGSTSATDNVNQNGALHFGCNTNGLVDNTGGIPGPNGSGVLMKLGFKPKTPGISDIAFQGFIDGTAGYLIRPIRGDIQGDQGEYGNTGLGSVDNCTPTCQAVNSLAFDMQGAVVQVTDPNAPDPTAVPATPTVVPAPQRSDTRATVRAVLGAPERTLSEITPIAGGPNSNGSAGSATGGGVSASDAGPAARTGSILPASSGSSSGSGTTASGAPRAGFGPDPQPANPWPGRIGGLLMVLGLSAIAGGAATRRGHRAS